MAKPKRMSTAQRDLNNREHVLYQFWNSEDVLLYVGISVDSATRIANHMRAKPWWSEVETIKFTKYPNRVSALAAEAEMIAVLKPLYNVQHNEMVDGEDDGADTAAHDLAVNVLVSTFPNELGGFLQAAGEYLEPNEQDLKNRDIAAAAYASTRIWVERRHTMRVLYDLVVLSGADPTRDVPEVDGLDTELAGVLAHANRLVDELAARNLANMPASEAEEWRQSAIAAGRTSRVAIDRWAARYAAAFKALGWLSDGHCAGPGYHGARCTRLVETTVYFEVCPLCKPGETCAGHGRWCDKHAAAVHYGRLEMLGGDPLATFPLARIEHGAPCGEEEVPF